MIVLKVVTVMAFVGLKRALGLKVARLNQYSLSARERTVESTLAS